MSATGDAIKHVAAKFAFSSRQTHLERSRHVYRSLLRETTYLPFPDPSVRQYVKKYIRWRFTNNLERTAKYLRQYETSVDETVRHEAKRALEEDLRKGHKGLYQHIRANEGEIKPLMKCLRLAYGRSGPRRHELMRSLLTPDVDLHQQTTTEFDNVNLIVSQIQTLLPDALLAPKNYDREIGTHVFHINPSYCRVVALLASQSQRNIEGKHRSKLPKRISIPARNSWNMPMPRKRVRNMVAKKYAKVLDALLPPLPEHEWEELRGWALGRGSRKWRNPPKRRNRPVGAERELTASDLEKLGHLEGTSKPRVATDEKARGYWTPKDEWLDNEDAIDAAYEDVLQDELQLKTLNKNLTGSNRGHTITPRLLQRLYLSLFRECPKLVPNGENEDGTRKWKVEWGASVIENPVNAMAREGVDSSAWVGELFAVETVRSE